MNEPYQIEIAPGRELAEVLLPLETGEEVASRPWVLKDDDGRIRGACDRWGDGWMALVDYVPPNETLRLQAAEEAPTERGVFVEEIPSGIRVSVNGAQLGIYQYGEEFAKPFFGPLIGPYGQEVTRPIDPSITEHKHHRGIFLAHGDVGGEEIWNEPKDKHGACRHRGTLRATSGPVWGGFQTRNEWVSRKEEPLLADLRTFTFYATASSCLTIDLELVLEAAFGDITLGDTKEAGFLGIRMHPDINVSSNRGGRIENAWGGVGESECWSRPAPWVDYSGYVEGNLVGIAVMDWPGNPRFPTKWHVRDYGLFAPNPWFWDGPLSLEEGGTLTFRYRILIHAGDAETARVKTRFMDYAFGREAKWVL